MTQNFTVPILNQALKEAKRRNKMIHPKRVILILKRMKDTFDNPQSPYGEGYSDALVAAINEFEKIAQSIEAAYRTLQIIQEEPKEN